MNAKVKKTEVVVTFSKPDPEDVKITKAAEFCRERLNQSAQAILDCGRRLAILKSDLKADDQKWRAAFGEDGDRKHIADNPFPFGSRMADILIQIHARLSAGTTVPVHLLPQSFGTLRELAQLPPARLELVADKVHPLMTGSEAKALAPKKKKTKTKAPSSKTIEQAHAIYLGVPKNDFLHEIVALVRDRGLKLEDLKTAWEAFT